MRHCRSTNVYTQRWQEQDSSRENARPLHPVPPPEVMFPGKMSSWRANGCCGLNTKPVQGERRGGKNWHHYDINTHKVSNEQRWGCEGFFMSRYFHCVLSVLRENRSSSCPGVMCFVIWCNDMMHLVLRNFWPSSHYTVYATIYIMYITLYLYRRIGPVSFNRYSLLSLSSTRGQVIDKGPTNRTL